jgi:N-acetylmuramoyl-L-alanine amidase
MFNLKKTFSIFIFSFIISVNGFAFTVLIDPGHGGEDNGATGRIKNLKGKLEVIKEKDLALSISKKIYDWLKKKKYEVYLTRSMDRSVGLAERAEMAEKIEADIFISVHINSCNGRHSKGSEVYYLDNRSDVATKKVEQIENESLEGDDLVINQIVIDLIIERTSATSKKLAKDINHKLKRNVLKKYHMVDRGVKPGLFYVLLLSKRPSALLEVGFISNRKELKRMTKKSFQDFYARSVAAGIDKFVKEKKKVKAPILF